MVGFVIETKLDESRLLARWKSACSNAAAGLGDAIRDDCEIYVPYDTGTLCRSVRRGAVLQTDDRVGCDVIWSAPYASAVYYGDLRGIRYHTEHHPHARARWFDGALASCGDAWLSGVRAVVRDGMET